jgi:hypothetical protein
VSDWVLCHNNLNGGWSWGVEVLVLKCWLVWVFRVLIVLIWSVQCTVALDIQVSLNLNILNNL